MADKVLRDNLEVGKVYKSISGRLFKVLKMIDKVGPDFVNAEKKLVNFRPIKIINSEGRVADVEFRNYDEFEEVQDSSGFFVVDENSQKNLDRKMRKNIMTHEVENNFEEMKEWIFNNCDNKQNRNYISFKKNKKKLMLYKTKINVWVISKEKIEGITESKSDKYGFWYDMANEANRKKIKE